MPHSLRSAGAMAVQGGDGGGSEPGGSEGPGELAGRAPMQLEEMEAATAHLDTAHVPASHLGTPLSELRPYVPRQGAAADGSRASCLAAPFADRLRVASDGSDGGGGAEEPGQTRTSPFYSTAADTAGAAAPMDASAAGSQQAAAAAGGGQQRPWYWEEEDPGKALAMLEDELREVAATCSTASPEDEGCQKMRRMLEAECEAIRASLAAPPGGGGGEPGSAGACGGSGKKRARVPHMGGGDTSILSGLLKHRGSGLLVRAWGGIGAWPPASALQPWRVCSGEAAHQYPQLPLLPARPALHRWTLRREEQAMLTSTGSAACQTWLTRTRGGSWTPRAYWARSATASGSSSKGRKVRARGGRGG